MKAINITYTKYRNFTRDGLILFRTYMRSILLSQRFRFCFENETLFRFRSNH